METIGRVYFVVEPLTAENLPRAKALLERDEMRFCLFADAAAGWYVLQIADGDGNAPYHSSIARRLLTAEAQLTRVGAGYFYASGYTYFGSKSWKETWQSDRPEDRGEQQKLLGLIQTKLREESLLA